MRTVYVALLIWLPATTVAAQEPLFVDVAQEVGLSGDGAAAWGDYDGDGWVDVWISGNLYRNEGGERFVRANDAAALPTARGGGTWGDCDNDGDLDLFLWSGKGALLRNNGDGTLSDAGADMPELPTVVSRGASWADLNGDGYLDLYVGGYEVWEKEMYPDVVCLNQGDGTLREHWRTPGSEMLSARGVTCADFDEDGDVDVYVSNYRLQPNILWRNDTRAGAPPRDLSLSDVAVEYNVAGKLKSKLKYMGGREYHVCGHTIGSAWGDLDGDARLDLFVGNFSHPPSYQDRPMFLRNEGPPGYGFEDKSGTAGLEWQESFASPALGDFDSDGDLDLYFTTVYKGDRSVLYRNEGNWRFADVTEPAGIQAERTYQSAWCDYDNDGDLDLLTGGKLYQNRTPGGHWLLATLRGDGSAIGAQARVRVGDRVLVRQVEGSTGEGNQNDMRLHFGLGEHADQAEIEVRWLGGARQTMRTPVDRAVTITQR
ncbi:MAG: CRTAC1 family protein [Armatimonadota bacterium]|jgi:hypothetical protein